MSKCATKKATSKQLYIKIPCNLGDTLYYLSKSQKIHKIRLDEVMCDKLTTTYLYYFDCDAFLCNNCPFGDFRPYGEEWDCNVGGTFAFSPEAIGIFVFLDEQAAIAAGGTL